jgi:hypothetical protein
MNTQNNAQREALTLIGAASFSYRDAAKICGTPVHVASRMRDLGDGCAGARLDGKNAVRPLPILKGV